MGHRVVLHPLIARIARKVGVFATCAALVGSVGSAGCGNSKRPPGHSHGFWADLFDDREHIACRPEYKVKRSVKAVPAELPAPVTSADPFARLPTYASVTRQR